MSVKKAELHIRALLAAPESFGNESDRTKAQAAFEKLLADAAIVRERKMVVELQIGSKPIEDVMKELESMRVDVAGRVMAYAEANGYTMPPAGSEWHHMDDEEKPDHLEPVIVTDGKFWGLSTYNHAYAGTGQPFRTIYTNAGWAVMGDVTHWRRMSAVALPDGQRMEEPQLAILKKGTLVAPCHKVALHWHQIHGMRLLETVAVRGKNIEVYRARCPECNAEHLVKK